MANTIQLATLEQELVLNTSKFDSAMSSASGLLKGLSTTVVAASTSILGLGGYAVEVGKSFESSMSQVAATMGMTSEEIANGSEAYEMLKQAAIDAGASTKYSATDAGEALNYLALAGYDAEKACQVLPTVLNLAAAGGMELASASDMVTDAMSALNIEATNQNVTRFSDELAKASQKSNTSVAQLGEAILTVGGTAKNLAGGTVELNTQLGILADNGVKGAEGGTALRNIILSLSAPTDKAASAMKDLGLKVYDANGKMRPTNEIFKDLNGILSDMTQGEQTQVLSTLFNKVDLKSVNALLANSGTRFDKLSGYITDCDGACVNMAETMSANLEGQLQSMGSAAESFGIAVYDKMQKPLTELASVGTEAIRKLTETFKTEGVNGTIQAAGEMLAGFIAQGASFAPQIVNMGVNVIKSLVNGISANAGSIASSAASLITTFASGIIELLPDILNTGVDLIVSLVNGIAKQLPQLVPMAVQAVLTLAQGIVDNLPKIVNAGINLISSLVQGIINSLPQVIQTAPKIINNFWKTFDSQLGTILKAGVKLIAQLAKGIISNLPLVVKNAGQIIQAVFNTIMHLNFLSAGKTLMKNLGTGIKNMLSSLGSAGKSAGNSVLNAIKKINWVNLGKTLIKGVVNGIKSLASAMSGGGKAVAQSAFNAIKGINWSGLGKTLINLVASGLKSVGSKLASVLKSAGTSAMNAFKNISWSSIGKNVINGIVSGVSSAAGALYDKLKGVASSALSAAKNALGIHSPSRVFRDQVGQYMALGIGEGFEGAMKSVNKDMENAIQTSFDLNPKLTANIRDNEFLKGLSQTVKSITVNVGDISVSGVSGSDSKIKNIVNRQIEQFEQLLITELGVIM